MPESLFFHVDLDAFFAAVEVLDTPSLKGKPLIIGRNEKRSVVSTCSYEARKFGVHSAMPMVTALKLCPQAICVPGNMRRYSEMSRRVMKIISEIAPSYIQASIDEAYLDMSGTNLIYNSPRDAAVLLKERIRKETGLTISVGVAGSRFIAKLASDYRKPDGLTIVPSGMEEAFVDAIGLRKLWGIGKVTYDKLERNHIRSPQELREVSIQRLEKLFGPSQAAYLYNVARGIDPGIYDGEAKSHSISSERTFIEDLVQEEAINLYLLELSQEVSFRALDEHFVPRTIGVKLRYGDFTTTSVQITPKDGIYNSSEVYSYAKELFWSKYRGGGIRLIGVGLYQLYEGEEIEQEELFRSDDKKKRELEKTILSLNRHGDVLKRASSLNSKLRQD